MIYYEYHKVTGQIMLVGVADLLFKDIEVNPEHYLASGEVDHVNQFHDVAAGKLANRPANPISADVEAVVANASDKVTFSDIPDGTKVEIIHDGIVTEDVVVGGSLELTFDKKGEYQVVLGKFPMHQKEFMINAD